MLSHGPVKARRVPPKEIELAVKRKSEFEREPWADIFVEGGIMAKKHTGKSKKTTADVVEILHRRYFADDPEKQALLEEERANAALARKIHDLRSAAGLSQRELAEMVGTTASVICRLEDADYEGHSLAMLRRIAAALDKQVQIRFVPLRRSAAKA